MVLLGLISDVHAEPAPVQEALAIFRRAGVQQVQCAGDIAGYHDELEETVALLVDNDVQTVVITSYSIHYTKLYDHRDV